MVDFLRLAFPEAIGVATDVAIKSTVLLTLALAAHLVLGRRRVLVRSALWNACLAGLVVLPLTSWASPRLRLTVLPPRAIASDETADFVRSIPLLDDRATTETHRLPGRSLPRRAVRPIEASAIGSATSIDPAPVRIAQPQMLTPPSAEESNPTRRPGVFEVLVGVYLSVVALLLLRLAVSLLAIGRLRCESESIENSGWLAALERWRSWMGISRRVALMSTDRISIPIAAGWLQPAVILPRSLAETPGAGLIDAVILHELSHVRRGDYGWNLLRRLVHIFYWPHPLIWPLGRILREVREQACDDVCIFAMGGASAYRASLIAVASGLVRRPEPGLGLAMAHITKLGRRLAWIEESRGSSRCLLPWPERLAVAAVLLAITGLLGSIELARAATKAIVPPETTQATPDEKAKTVVNAPQGAIEVIVVGKDTGKPLASATVRSTRDLVHPEWKTDRDGRIRINLSHDSFQDTLNLDVWAEGYVQQRHSFAQNNPRFAKIPGEFTVELLPSEQTLGGTVVDEQGHPMAGVKVRISGYLGEKKEKHELAWMVDAQTDQQGRWRGRSFRNMTFAYLFLSHPDYVADGDSYPRKHGQPRPSNPPKPDEQPMQALRDFTDRQVMIRGVAIAGTVSDQAGKPIAGAEVICFEASDPGPYDDAPLSITDAQGQFRFPHVRPKRMMLRVKARGHAPEMKPVAATDRVEPVVVTLGPPHVLAGRVVDTQNRPIPDAFVHIDTWRGRRFPRVFLKSRSDGRFRWEDAPADPVLVDASRTGYSDVFQQRATPDSGEIVLTLRRELSISGHVRDAVTDNPIDKAELEVGIVKGDTGKVSWNANSRSFVDQGYLQASLDTEKANQFRLRIKAKGYEPFESRVFQSDEGQVEYDVKLTKAEKPQGVLVTGIVHRPDATPLEGAEVVVTYPMIAGPSPLPRVHIEDGQIRPVEDQAIVKTDAQGRFRSLREPGPAGKAWAVIVVHPEFYAEVDRAALEKNSTITAGPWGRLEGFARTGAKPASGAEIRYGSDRIANRDIPYVLASGRTKADARGRFIFDRVIPGDVRVAFQYERRASGLQASTNGTLVEVKSGEVAQVKMGGSGRALVARIAPPLGFDPNADYTSFSAFNIGSDRPMIPYPQELLARRDGSMIEWARKWRASPEGRAYRRDWFQLQWAPLQSDGTVRVEDLPPGDYQLTLTYTTDPISMRVRSPERTAHAFRQFRIPEVPGAASGQPFDLGILRPRPRRMLKIGELAPPFKAASLDGRRIKLQDYRGKHVLLIFWASWCAPCIAELPELKAVHDRFGADERFAMVSLSLDGDKEASRNVAAEQGLRWTQGFLGDWPEGGAQDAYHVQVIPSVFLIGPAGKLEAVYVHANTIATVVAKALNEP